MHSITFIYNKLPAQVRQVNKEINTLFIHDNAFDIAGGVVYVSRCMCCCLKYLAMVSKQYLI